MDKSGGANYGRELEGFRNKLARLKDLFYSCQLLAQRGESEISRGLISLIWLRSVIYIVKFSEVGRLSAIYVSEII